MEFAHLSIERIIAHSFHRSLECQPRAGLVSVAKFLSDSVKCCAGLPVLNDLSLFLK